ncbi:hypothetical protein M6D81_28030 [Paenibacillus sp. J5C_2022]|uniref:hypothetical protein n=1 Tax=Paenibacillus sp. J5C2022 TaxID=2977129 RepID=UPI0021CFE938|nr:hypothetical protein [Paenibacillus sp. J5C2022]MCU6712553.1 hypothetical protein [Paenibacillus sp. J5C2022]
MNVWRGAWFLAKHELVRARWKHLIIFIIIGYMLMMMIPWFSSALKGEADGIEYWAIDFITVTILPVFGFSATQYYTRTWSGDLYTRRLAYWRTLPISITTIVRGRVLMLLLNGMLGYVVFFVLYYLGLKSLNNSVDVLHFIMHAVVLTCVAVIISMFYVYMELGFSSKAYFVITLVTMFLILFLILLASFVTGNSLVLKSYELIVEGKGWYLTIISLLLAALAVFTGIRLIESKLEKRNFYS